MSSRRPNEHASTGRLDTTRTMTIYSSGQAPDSQGPASRRRRLPTRECDEDSRDTAVPDQVRPHQSRNDAEVIRELIVDTLSTDTARMRTDEDTLTMLDLFHGTERFPTWDLTLDRSKIAKELRCTSYPVVIQALPSEDSRYPEEPDLRLVVDTTRFPSDCCTKVSDVSISNDSKRVSTVKFELNIIPDIYLPLNQLSADIQQAFGEFVAGGGDPDTLRLYIGRISTNDERYDEETSVEQSFSTQRKYSDRTYIEADKIVDSFISHKSEFLGKAKVYFEFGDSKTDRRSFDLGPGRRRRSIVGMRLQLKPVELVVTRGPAFSRAFRWMGDIQSMIDRQ